MAATDSAPDTTTVARALDADPDNLALFVDHHPDPSVAVVLSAAVVGRDRDEITPETRRAVAEWIAHRQRQWPGPRDEVLSYLRRHGPATEHEITEGLSRRNARIVRPTLSRLVRRGTVDRQDREDGPALFSLD
jgi:hypothetical protein